jgi:hypothetical protein
MDMANRVDFMSFKLGGRVGFIGRVTVRIQYLDERKGMVDVSFGYQSPRDYDCRKDGQCAATDAYYSGKRVSVRESVVRSRRKLTVLALSMAMTHYTSDSHDMIGWIEEIIEGRKLSMSQGKEVSEAMKAKIRKVHAEGVSIPDCVQRFGLSRSGIANILIPGRNRGKDKSITAPRSDRNGPSGAL